MAILLCDIFFDKNNPNNYLQYCELVLEEYKKENILTEVEIITLPLYTRAAHAMHVINAGYELQSRSGSEEDEYWYQLGKSGLIATKDWK